jgi:hypothetical protein
MLGILKPVRLCAVARNPEWEGSPTILDIVVDENNIARSGLVFFGIWGGIGHDDAVPFVLMVDGQMDFGAGFQGVERFEQTNLLTKKLVAGEFFSISMNGAEIVYKISKIIDLSQSSV